MAKTKLSRINSQVRENETFNQADDAEASNNMVGFQRTIFANVADAKSFYYTDNQLACFDTHCETVQWALVNDDDGDATKLKFTAEFAGGVIPGKDRDWQDALEAIQDEFPAHAAANFGDSTLSITSIEIADSSDHLF